MAGTDCFECLSNFLVLFRTRGAVGEGVDAVTAEAPNGAPCPAAPGGGGSPGGSPGMPGYSRDAGAPPSFGT